MIHLDLFSGIGLFSYAVERVWNLEHIFCEIEDWPYRFLKQEYPNARIERDIKNFDGTEHAGGTFLLTAGVPCQPASVAGKRKGTEDDRWLWPEALRVMAEAKPQWCIFENPLGILTLENGLVFENLVLEMESQGYSVQPYIIPAGSVSAIHRRYRVWIVARNTKSNSINTKQEIHKRSDTESKRSNSNASYAESRKTHTAEQRRFHAQSGSKNTDASNPSIARSGELSKSERWHDSANIERSGCDVANTAKFRCKSNGKLDSGKRVGQKEKGSHTPQINSNSCNSTSSGLPKPQTAKIVKSVSDAQRRYWQKPWSEVATELCRVDVSPTDRVHRLKALGNTIQWEVAVEIMQAIKEIKVMT